MILSVSMYSIVFFKLIRYFKNYQLLIFHKVMTLLKSIEFNGFGSIETNEYIYNIVTSP